MAPASNSVVMSSCGGRCALEGPLGTLPAAQPASQPRQKQPQTIKETRKTTKRSQNQPETTKILWAITPHSLAPAQQRQLRTSAARPAPDRRYIEPAVGR